MYHISLIEALKANNFPLHMPNVINQNVRGNIQNHISSDYVVDIIYKS